MSEPTECKHFWYLAEEGGTIWWADGRTEILEPKTVTVCVECGERREPAQPSLA